MNYFVREGFALSIGKYISKENSFYGKLKENGKSFLQKQNKKNWHQLKRIQIFTFDVRPYCNVNCASFYNNKITRVAYCAFLSNKILMLSSF